MAKIEIAAPPRSERKRPETADFLVGIGGGTGSLEALESILEFLPSRHGMAIVAILSLPSDDADSISPAIAAACPGGAVEIEDGLSIRANTLYLAPPRSLINIERNRFRVQNAPHDRAAASPIDYFFHALSQARGSAAVGIVLSGAGTDGTLGLKAISDAGGMTMAQSPQSAAFDSMPRSAATTGIADHILAPGQIAVELSAYHSHQRQSRGEYEKQLRTAIIAAIPRVAKALQAHNDHDFRHYKPSTLARRIQRRMQLVRMAEVDEYLLRLESSAEECNLLFRELLIGVTEFFRDKEAFEFLEKQVLPKLFDKRHANDQIRIWVAGCSTGEEAYSIAMLVREQLDLMPNPPSARVFATDIDERALSIARKGSYPLGIAEDIAPERLRRFFVKRGMRYQARKEIRELCVFSGHNLISDPPFSRQDLICCRNLLIYLGAHLQKKIIPLFHYALRPRGFLFLGPSEGLESHRELFQQLHPKHRISVRKSSVVEAPAPCNRTPSNRATEREKSRDDQQPDLPRIMQRMVLDEFAPQSVVVNDDGNVLCASGDVSDFLTLSNGSFENNVIKMARPGLRTGLRAALREANSKKRQIAHDRLAVRVKQGVQELMLTVQPMPELGEGNALYLIVFQRVGLPRRPSSARSGTIPEDDESLVDQLERDLHDTRDELERTIQDLEAANEELKSSNEELLSMNEELQSTNEEMETSKEEVQTANQSLAQANSDLQNLLSSTRIATLFLDDDGCIRNFTPAIADIYRLIPTDIGRPIADITSRAIDMPDLPSRQELARLGQIEHEIQTKESEWFIRRVSPYRSLSDQQQGMVITFTRVTGLKSIAKSLEQSERALRESQEQLRFILASADVGTWMWHKATNRVTWSENLEAIHGRAPGSFGGTFESVFEDVWPEDRLKVEQTLQVALTKRLPYRSQYRILLPDGSLRWLEAEGRAVHDENGELLSMSGLCRDISERKLAEQRILAEHAISHAIANGHDLVESAPTLLEAFAHCLDIDSCEIWLVDENSQSLRWIASHVNRNCQQALSNFDSKASGLRLSKGDGVPGRVWKSGSSVWALDEDVPKTLVRQDEAIAAGLKSAIGFPIVAGQTIIGVFAFYARHRLSPNEALASMMQAIGIDLGQLALRARAEHAIRASEYRFRTLSNVVPVLVWASGVDTLRNDFNERWLQFTGRTPAEETGSGWTERIHPDDREHCLTRIAEAAKNGSRFRVEYRLMRHDGAYRWLIDEGAPIHNDDGTLSGYIGGCVDITNTKETEIALRLANEQRRLALQAADIGLWDWDIQNDHLYLDQRCRALLEVKQNELVTSATLAQAHPDDRERLTNALNKALNREGGGVVNIEYRPLGSSQSAPKWLALMGEVAFEGDALNRRAARVVGTLQDITPRKLAEEALRESEKRNKFLLQTGHDAVYVYPLLEDGTPGRFVDVNEQAHRQLGYSRPEFLSMCPLDIITVSPDAKTGIYRKLNAEKTIIVQSRHRKRDGSFLDVEVSATLVQLDGQAHVIAKARDITDRLKAETALRDSEARFKAYFDSAPTPLWEKDWSELKDELDRLSRLYPDLRGTLLENPEIARSCLAKTRIVDANAAAVDLFRASDRQDMIDNGHRIICSRTPEAMAQILCALQAGGNRFRFEEEITTFHSEKRVVLCEFVALPGHERSLRRLLVSRVDITDRKRAEEAAALTAAIGAELASGLDFQTTLSKLAQSVVPSFADWCSVDLAEPDGSTRRVAMAHVDPQKVALANEIHRRYGHPLYPHAGPGKVLQTREADWMNEIPPEMIGRLARDETHRALIEKLGARSYVCVPLVARDVVLGAITFVAAESGRRYDSYDVSAAGAIARHASQAIDNARLYQLQIEALREAKEAQSLLDTIVAAAPVGVALLDREFRFVQVNKVMAEINGAAFEAHLDRTFSELRPDLWPAVEPICRDLLAGSNATQKIESSGDDDGSDGQRSFVYTFYPIPSAAGDVAGIGVLVEEITERKRFEESLARARQQAEAANRSKSEFLANMSHEIRTPMTSILGYSDILQHNLEDPDDIQCVNTIRRNGEFLLEIINDILDLSRIESGNLEVSMERCQPDLVVAEVVSLMDVRAKEKRLALEVEFQGDIPESIETDPIRLRQVLINLVGNAVKFTHQGYVRLSVQFLIDQELMRCDVVDTGIGMTQDQLQRIFQPFRQADSSVSRRFGGSGLGLTICERLVDMLGGSISATSELDVGSAFTFTIRTGSLAGVPMGAPRSAIVARPGRSFGQHVSLSCRALVVDDRREIRQLAQHYIEEAGGHASVAENGLECIEAVQRADKEGKPFDIVIIDMQMPVMDGYEATRRLRSLGFAKPIIALTAHAMKGDREKSMIAGCDDYATKPIDEPALIELIAKNTRHRDHSVTMEAKAEPPALAATKDADTEAPAKKRRLLIVEDNVNLRRVLALTFEKRGHEVRVAATAQAALDLVAEFQPQVALLDLGLPDMSGLELVAQLRLMPEMRETRIFALSGRDDPAYIAKSQEAGFDRHVVKPPDVDALERLFYQDLKQS